MSNFSNDQSLPLHVQIRREMERTNPRALESHAASADPQNSSGCSSSNGVDKIFYKELSYAIVGAVIEVHRHLGPGQLESNYEQALAHELAARSIAFKRQVSIESIYKGKVVGTFVADMIVNEQIVLELKAVERIHPAHSAQLLSYLRATNLKLGLLINFNEAVAWKGIKRVVR